jgi:hypothetical protein
MSLNLHCNKIELWQTPTYISVICLTSDDGYKDELKGAKAKSALTRYCKWAELTFNGEKVKEHIHKVQSLDIKDLKVCIY